MKTSTVITHIMYCLIIVFLLVVLGAKRFLAARVSGDGYLLIQSEIKLIEPLTGKQVGVLNGGVVLKAPCLDDVRDTDIGDNDRFKLLLDVVGRDPTNCLYIRKSSDRTDLHLGPLRALLGGRVTHSTR